jgi:hypothetical protein
VGQGVPAGGAAGLVLEKSSAADYATQWGQVTNAALGPDVARANLLTNGGFEIWQRGTGAFTAYLAYGPDRWILQPNSPDTMSVSRNTANVDTGSAACAAVTFTHSTGSGSLFRQRIEDVANLKTRTLTFSMRVSCATANAVRIGIADNVNPYVYSAYHPGDGTYHTLSVTLTVAATATTLDVFGDFEASCTAYIDNAMLVVGSQPADYVPMHPADDLARCLRYYEMVGAPADATLWFEAYASTANQNFSWPIGFKAQKAVTPTATIVGTWGLNNCTMTLPVGAGVSTSAVRLTSSAAGQMNARNTGAGATLTFEANP